MKDIKKQIMIVLIIGSMLIAADLIMSDENGVEVERSYGQLYLIRPEAGVESGYLSLKAEVESENGIYEKKLNIRVEPYERGNESEAEEMDEENNMLMSEEEQMDYYLRSIADNVNLDVSERKVSLPAKLETGESITWHVEEKKQSNTFTIVLMMIGAIILLYREKYAAVRRKEAEEQESVLRQLPGFINRLVLLLNAGLVINSAFERAVEESVAVRKEKNDYFYMNLNNIYASMKTANGSMGQELKAFARRSKVQELMRVSNIINDNVSKGTELTGKLQSESELLWIGRKKRCEEIGRLAETKLTLPLMLFLLVLIVITIAPALLEL